MPVHVFGGPAQMTEIAGSKRRWTFMPPRSPLRAAND
ncbi:MAG: hypothetical protein ABWY07_01005 [Burkholderiales bacterium]